MTLTNTFKTEPALTTIAAIMSLLIIIKYGIIVYILLVVFYILATKLLIYLDILFHPKHPYHKFLKVIRGCFALEDEIWLDESLDSEFTALTNFCKSKGYKITLFSEQLDTFSKVYKDDPKNKVFNRIGAMQTAKVLRLLPAVKASSSKPNPFCEYINDEEDKKSTNIGIIYEAPAAPKPKNPKKEFIKALTHYAKVCQQMTYVSKDPEIKVLVTDFNEKNPDNKINIFPFGKDFKEVFDYLEIFKIKFVEAQKKKKKAKSTKKADRKKQLENIKEAAAVLSKDEIVKKKIEEKTEKILEEKSEKE